MRYRSQTKKRLTVALLFSWVILSFQVNASMQMPAASVMENTCAQMFFSHDDQLSQATMSNDCQTSMAQLDYSDCNTTQCHCPQITLNTLLIANPVTFPATFNSEAALLSPVHIISSIERPPQA